MSNKEVFSVKIGGQAGQGVKSAGLMLAKVANRSGYHIFTYTEYPSLIRGGHNVMQINISPRPVLAPFKTTDLLVALNKETVDLHLEELQDGGGIIFEGGDNSSLPQASKNLNLYPIPLSKLATDTGEKELLINSVALGAILAILGGQLSTLQQLIGEEFASKGNPITLANNQAAQAGYDYAVKNFAQKRENILKPLEESGPASLSRSGQKMIVNGNEAISLGAIAGGLQFASIYPMTPITNILHFLALHQDKYGYIYKQPEDEIAAINMAIGASFAGARAMTATSGGGFCLMSEGYGLAAITETPLVIIEGMRGGPATGLPTWSGQGDLQFVLHAHQGDFPRLVLAPGDAQEAFILTRQAFNLADKYQTPVVILVDKNICESDQSFPVFDTAFEVNRGKMTRETIPGYQRFADNGDGVSLRATPGSGNFFIANSYEHDFLGLTTERINDRQTQMAKRMTKLESCQREDLPSPQLFGPEEADITIVSWGSNKGVILEAVKHFDKVNFLHLTWLSPFLTPEIRKRLEQARYLIDIECNYSGQLANLIKEKTGVDILDRMLKVDGRPFFVEEIVEKITSVLEVTANKASQSHLPNGQVENIIN